MVTTKVTISDEPLSGVMWSEAERQVHQEAIELDDVRDWLDVDRRLQREQDTQTWVRVEGAYSVE